MENEKLSAESQDFDSSLDLCVCTNIRRAARAITRLYDDALADMGVRYTQMIFLMVLQRFGEMTVSQLAEELVMDASTVARNIRPLEREGLITINKGKDRRQRLVSLSKSGQKAVKEGMKSWQQAQGKYAALFSEQELRDRLAAVYDLTEVALEA